MPLDPLPPSKKRRRVLFLAHSLPYPPDGGVWIRTYNVLRQLSASFDVTVLCFERLGTANQAIDTDASVAHLRGLAHFELFPLPQKRSKWVYLRNHLASVLSATVYTRHVYESPAFRGRLRELIAEGGFDLVHMDSLDLSGYIDELSAIPVVCTHHNVESALLRRRSKVEGSFLGSRYIRLQARLMEAEERRWCPAVAMNVFCSDIDMRLLQSTVPGSPGTVIPNGVDVDEFRPIEPVHATSGSVFVGATSWFPNLDALIHFAEDILPHIRSQLPSHRARWVGSATEEQVARFGPLGVDLLGYVDDVRVSMSEANVFVVPLRAGGGTRLKILNAWSMGCAVVSTPIGCEGLEAVDGHNILIREDPADFARAVVEVERDADLRARLGQEARRTAENVYSWSIIGERLVELYECVIQGSPHSGEA